MTREQWLMDLTGLLRPVFKEKGFTIPEKVRVSCGWPSVRPLSKKKRAIGECWHHKACTDGSSQIFISPVLQDSMEVAATHVHELLHACVGTEHGHKGPFLKGCRLLGLAGKATATTAGPELLAALQPVLDVLGPYPNSTLDTLATERPGGKKQGTRMLKLECPAEGCGYTVRTTQKWLDRGVPTCPCGTEMVAPDGAGEPEPEEEGGEDE